MWIDTPVQVGMQEEGLELRGEHPASAGQLPQVERLLSRAIPGEDQPTFDVVPNRDGKHPVKPREDVCPPLLESMDHDLCVAVICFEVMAELGELGPEITEVVDLAIEDKHMTSSLIEHGLVTA